MSEQNRGSSSPDHGSSSPESGSSCPERGFQASITYEGGLPSPNDRETSSFPTRVQAERIAAAAGMELEQEGSFDDDPEWGIWHVALKWDDADWLAQEGFLDRDGVLDGLAWSISIEMP
jgi:hypothetical protein